MLKTDHQNRWLNFGFFLISVWVACYRDIDFLKDPVPFAEEGTYFISESYKSGFWALGETYAGYIQVPQVLATTIGIKLFGMLNLPYFLAWVSILVSLLPCGLILFGNSKLNLGPYSKFFLSILTLVAGPEANSYSVLHFNFIWCWILVLIYFETEGNRWFRNILYNGLIFFGPLSGPMSVFLVPFFFVKYIQTRTKSSWYQFLLLFISSLVSFGFFLFKYQMNPASAEFSDRFNDFDLHIFLFNYFVDFLAGNSLGSFEELKRPLAVVSFIVLCITVYHNFSKKYVKELFFMILVLSILPIVLSLGMRGGFRYVYVSNLVFVMLLLYLNKEMVSYMGIYLASILLFAGLSYTTKHSRIYVRRKLSWPKEIAKWEQDSTYKPAIYPFNDWDTSKPWRIDLLKHTP